MRTRYFVTIEDMIENFSLEEIFLSKGYEDIKIYHSDINRPGLEIMGYYEYFDVERIQIFGKTEMGYLGELLKEKRLELLDKFFSHKPVAVIITTDLDIYDEFVVSARKYNVPVFRTGEKTSTFTAAIVSQLNVDLAKRITRHGVLVDVYGEGILIIGGSGVGKSETAVELIKRGHRLIADDAVELRRVSSKTIVGTSPENIRHFIELRGIGIINAARIFGVSGVKMTANVDLIIHVEPWNEHKEYDRLGLDDNYTSILDIEIPSTTIPVNPGRNLAVIIEVAAMNHRQKKMGYNSARELMDRLGMGDKKSSRQEDGWDGF